MVEIYKTEWSKYIKRNGRNINIQEIFKQQYIYKYKHIIYIIRTRMIIDVVVVFTFHFYFGPTALCFYFLPTN
jgi:hypothetical protein